MKFICEECGSDKVQQLQWVDVNTNKIIGEGPSELNECWCEKCNEHTKLTTNESVRKKITDLIK
jgi:hypothetical protein|tara:strand:- start:433 stop:624 length:192 start_codon:yes stop_codon:yes gene_type:complete